ncbi:MAG: helix-turn-helix transcriptional regulator [Neisseriaceae bacterium]|nr:MAG: helix-turn-helix transcriptional regulator [Neisseriaceae bacterium]
MNYTKIITEYIEANHKNLNQFCKEYEINYGMMHSIVNGKKSFEIAAAKNIEDKIYAKTGVRIFSDPASNEVKLAAVKLFHIKASAGVGRECFLEDSNEPIGMPWKILKRYGLNPDDVMALEVDGISMIPTYNPEDYIFVATTAEMKRIRNFEPYLIRYDNELMIKRLEQIGDNLIMHSDNPDKNKYPPRNIIKGIDFEIIGRIFKKLGD